MSLELRVRSQNFAPVSESTSNRMTGIRERLQSREPLSSGPKTEGSERVNQKVPSNTRNLPNATLLSKKPPQASQQQVLWSASL